MPRGYSKAMDFLYLALLLAALLALIYLIRSMRALHKKVGKQTERLAAGIQKLTEQNRNRSEEHTSELQSH